MKARIAWHDQVAFVAESGSGHALILDGAPDHGGRNLGPRPMELILMGLGSCASFDVMTILTKQRQAVSACVCELDATRAEEGLLCLPRLRCILRCAATDSITQKWNVQLRYRLKSTAPPRRCWKRRGSS